jgi:hypothetical protein
MTERSEVVASAPRSRRLWLWNQRVTLAILASVWPILLLGEAVGLVEAEPGVGWLAHLLGAAAIAWLVYVFGFVFTLRLELTRSGQIRWFGAFRQGSIDVADIDRISTDAAPFLWTVTHAHGRLLVVLVSDMKGSLYALDELRADGDSRPSGDDQATAPGD